MDPFKINFIAVEQETTQFELDVSMQIIKFADVNESIE